MKKYKVEVIVKHIEWIMADDEHEAKEKAEGIVYERSVNTSGRADDLMTGYKVVQLAGADDTAGRFV